MIGGLPREPTAMEPRRLKGFVAYFNSYIATLAVAVIPIPIANWHWIPIFDAQRHVLSTVTPLFCFLTIGFLFSFRQSLAGPMFPDFARRGRLMQMLKLPKWLEYILSQSWDRLVNFAPLGFTLAAFWSAASYYTQLTSSIEAVGSDKLLKLQLAQIPGGGNLICYFVLTFVLAEAAFVWMALKEYLQDVLGLTDLRLIEPRPDMPAPPAPTR